MVGKFYNNQRVYVEADYDNIFVVDPNKIVNKEGKVEERLVNHEELVIYANLESKIIPRTKLANGVDFDQAVQNIRVASIDGDESLNYNMLKPKGKKYFDTSWSDQITGDGSTEGKGSNQSRVDIVGNGFTQRKVKSTINNEDTQLFGITDISIKTNPSYTPQVTITMVDVQGRALFEQGENSPYSAFMQFPYPLFTLTVKGYYGKAVRYELMLENFNARFDSSSGNYIIETKFVARSFALLNEIVYDYLNVLPKIGPTQTQIQDSPNENQNGNQTVNVRSSFSTKGRQKLDEVYSEYKTKGLIDENFPHLTVEEMKFKLDRFERYVMESYGQEDISVINDIEDYAQNLVAYKSKIFPKVTDNWFDKYVDESEVYVLNNLENSIYYKFKKELDNQKILDAINELNAIIIEYNNILNRNATFGLEGKYKIKNEEKKSNLNSDIKKNDIIKTLNSLSTINFRKTFELRKGIAGTDSDIEQFKSVLTTDFQQSSYEIDTQTNQISEGSVRNTFIFFGETQNNTQSKNSYLSILSELENNFNEIRLGIEEQLTDALSDKVQNSETGLGFSPTVGNVTAVLCASADAFLRLMDDVHFDAWNQRKNPIRLKSIISPDKSFGIDNKNSVESVTTNGQLDNTSVVYPWPQYFEKGYDDKGEEKFIAKYPGLPQTVTNTQGYKFDVWPEIGFVESYIKAAITRETISLDLDFNNEFKMTKFVNFNSAEFPLDTKPYSNLNEVSYLYEIFERSLFLSSMNRLSEYNDTQNELYSILGDLEVINIQESVKDSPKLSKTLKEFRFDPNSYLIFLKSISNEGMGLNWNQLIRDVYSTTYLKNVIDKPFGIYNIDLISDESTSVQNNSNSIDKLITFLDESTNNDVKFTDTFPFTNLDSIKNLLSNSIENIEDAFNTQGSYTFNSTKKVISSFKMTDDITENKPFTYFDWIQNDLNNPNQSINNTNQNIFSINNIFDYKEYYQSRTIDKFYLSEGEVKYSNDYDDSFNISENQTTSLFNTPYFINSILKGNEKEKNGSDNPYVTMGYLFLNSLPLSTLHQKSKTYSEGLTTENNYLFSTLSKFSAIHKLPYLWILRYGSIWYRYKNRIINNEDILDDVWNSVDYKNLYDPNNNDLTKSYNFNIENQNIEYRMYEQSYNNILQTTNTNIKSGIYPKLINEIYYLFTKKSIFDSFSENEVSQKLDDYNINIQRSTDPFYLNLQNFSGSVSTQEFSVSLDTTDNIDFTDNKENKILIIPSGGYLNYNQSNFEFFDNNIQTTEISENTAYYNGSFRTLWNSPNFGFFNSDDIAKPTYNQYLKLKNILSSGSFGVSNNVEDYEYIDDIFSIFDIEVLDEFERHFLNFCSRKESIKDIVQNPAQKNQINFFGREKANYNIGLFEMMEKMFFVEKIGSNTNEDISNKQSSNLKDFYKDLLEYDVIFKNGNAGSFERRTFNSLSEGYKPTDSIDPDVFVDYDNTNADVAFLLNIGDSQNNDYKNACLDFFPEMNIEYSEFNVNTFSKIIKIYGSQKMNQNETNYSSEFRSNLEQFLDIQNKFQNDILNHTFINLNRKLPSIVITEDETIDSRIDGNVGKNDQYYTFKALNDRWVAGQDLRSRTIFEDFLFLDKSMKPVGSDILIDIESFRGLLNSSNANLSLYYLIGSLMDQNKFTMMPAPSYTNFYGRNTRIKNSESLPEDIGNNIFGTFMEVDVNESKPKVLCIFVGNVSETTDQQNNTNYVFNNDSFDLRKSQINPLKDNLDGITDFSSRNKVVGFNVDFGTRNQGVFKNIAIDMSQHKATSLTFKIQEDMANQFGGQEVSQQSQSLYNYYKSQSYNCSVDSFGNAMIQPTMYFHLSNVPMFHGTYLILDVTHNITPGNFNTNFNGVRLPVYVTQVPDKLVASINRDLIKKYRDSIRNIPETNESNEITNTTSSGNQNETSQTGTTVPTTSSNCLYVTKYSDLIFQDPVQGDQITFQEITQYLEDQDVNVYLKTFIQTIGIFETDFNNYFNNNLFKIRTDRLYGGVLPDLISSQFCAKLNQENISYAGFDEFEKSIDFMILKYKGLITNEILTTFGGQNEVGLTNIYWSSWKNNFLSGNTNEVITQINNQIDNDSNLKSEYDLMLNLFKSRLNQNS